MENQALQTTDYNTLLSNGLKLSEADFKLILTLMTTGAEEAKTYLNVPADNWPRFNFSNETHTLGYSSSNDAICISINHINQAAARSTQLEFKDQLVMFIPDKFYLIEKYTYWLKLLGREATIHRYQKAGNPRLHIPFPAALPQGFSIKLLFLSNLEVEARKAVDEIAQNNKERPVWNNVDNYFSTNYPQYYNKTIDELTKMTKPDFPFSFEMEFYTL